ncbi:MAG: methionyl-tRNA formyltransferase [Chloroflexota bacterium]|nr:methionyl-tRNA formyltransferase [Chloroflexota bacterium]MDE2897437.1 methionyl-tRNA formyltransferase [Chloroflexota bacterium]
MRIVFFGTPDFAVPSLRRLTERFDVALVVTRPDRPVGRGGRLTPPPVATVARDLDLDLFQPANPNKLEAVEAIASYEPQAVVCVAYGRLLGTRLRRLATPGIVNAHPSLLPAYRGASPIQGALLDGAGETGVTLIRLVRALDAGPIVAVERSQIDPDETAAHLHGRLADLTAELLIRVLPAWAAGELTEEPQDEAKVTLTRPLERADADLDLRRSAAELYNRWRAFQPWPGVRVRAGDTICGLTDVRLGMEQLDPGQVRLSGEAFLLGCGDGSLAIRALQPAGRKRMTAAAFARGYQGVLHVPWGHPYPEARPPLIE